MKLQWEVVRTVMGECPDYVPNEATGEYPRVHCDVLHCKLEYETRTKEFPDVLSMVKFVGEAPKEPPLGLGAYCLNFKVIEL